MRRLVGHTKEVRALAYLPDGRLVTGGQDGTVRFWNPLTGENTATWRHRSPVYAVAVRPDGGEVAVAGRRPPKAATNRITLLDPDTGTSTQQLDWRVTADGLRYNPLVFTPEWVGGVLPVSIWSLSYSADSEYLAAACRRPGGGNIPDGCLGHWWRGKPYGPQGPIAGRRLYGVSCGPTGNELAATGHNVILFFDRMTDPEPRSQHRVNSQWAEAVVFLTGGDVAVIGANSFLHFVDPTGAAPPVVVKSGFRVVTALAPLTHGAGVLVGGKPSANTAGAVEVRDAIGGLRSAFDLGVSGVFALAVSPDGTTCAVAGEDGLAVGDADLFAG